MAAHMAHPNPQRWSALRKLPWIAAAVLLLLPAVAMRLHVEGVAWSAGDFIVMGAMLLIACGSFELAARLAPNAAYLAAATLGIGTGFVLVWANLAVGIVGDGLNDANMMFFGVIVFALAVSLIARFRASGMARAMAASAILLLLAIAIGLAAFGATAREALLASMFALAWLVSAALFHRAGQGGANAHA